jgi:hypothetical protein
LDARGEAFENAFAFPWCGLIREYSSNVLRECGSNGDTAGLMLEKAPGPPVEIELLERKTQERLIELKKNEKNEYPFAYYWFVLGSLW